MKDLTPLCRVCLQQPKPSNLLDVQLIYDEDEALSYSECFSICTQIELSVDDGGPQNLCKCCGLELQMAYDFYKKVEMSKKKLQQLRRNDDILHSEDEVQSYAAEEEFLQDDENDFLDVVDNQSYVDRSTEDAEIMHSDTDQRFYDEEYIIGSIPMSDEESTKQSQLTWQQAVVAVANESHLPVKQDITCEVDVVIVDNDENKSNNNNKKQIKAKLTNRKRFAGKFNCDYCQKVFPNHSRMMLHRRSHELNRPKFVCAECDRVYTTKQSLEVHVLTVHKKTGFSCCICGKIYAIKKGLEIHMRFHTRDFPYICDLCGKKFAQVSHLNTHKNVKHNSERFCCEYPGCKKNFTSSASLRNHEFSHGPDMPFECEFCQLGYPAKSKLKAHIRRKHGKDMTLDELEHMRKFHIKRSKLNMIRVQD